MFKLVGLVRDKDGNPKIDDASKLHPLQIAMLTHDERVERELWPGPFAVDAQGFKRLTKEGGDYIAFDSLVAASQVFDEGETKVLARRIDVPPGMIVKGI